MADSAEEYVPTLEEEIVEAFKSDFEHLPAIIQEKINSSKVAGEYRIGKQEVDDFLRDRLLDGFIKRSPDAFRQALIKVYGQRKHPFLSSLSGIKVPAGLPRLPSFIGSFKPRTKPAEKSGGKEPVGDPMTVDEDEEEESEIAYARAAEAITTTMAVDQPAESGGYLGSLRLHHPSVHESIFPTPDNAPVQAGEDETESHQGRPVIPGFTISTRSRPPGSGAGVPLVENPAVPSEDTSQRDAENEDWLRNWMQQSGISTASDLMLHPYKGWKIEAPKIQLIRAKNFLSDEDVDRTVDWPRKFAELAEYFSYLLHNFHGEDWGYDLREAIDMLHTHWVFENYHYGRPKLNLDLPTAPPPPSKRLPPGPGPVISMEPRDPSDDRHLGERPLTHRKLESAHDEQYGMSASNLSTYLKRYDANVAEFWANPQTVQEPYVPEDDNNFNMVRAEDAAYSQCMDGGMNATADYLAGPGNFQFSPDDIGEVGDSKYVMLDSLRSFANFRGARRAALQQCLNTFDNFENHAAKTPWRALILPDQRPESKKAGEYSGAGVVLKHKPVENVPEKAARDPYAYTVGLRRYQRKGEYWAQWTRKHAVKEAYGHKLWLGRVDPPMDVPPNFLGPYEMHYMDIGIKKLYDLEKRCQSLMECLWRADDRYERSFVHKVIRFVVKAFRGDDYRTVGLRFRPSEIRQAQDTVVPIRPKEEEWLHYLCSERINRQAYERPDEGERNPLSIIFEERVKAMKNDGDQDSFFNRQEERGLNEFLKELNACAGGDKTNKKYQFTIKEASMFIAECAEAGILEESLLLPKGNKRVLFDYSNSRIFLPEEYPQEGEGVDPEHRVQGWMPETVDLEAGNPDLTQSRFYREALRIAQEEAEAEDDADSTWTQSTKVSVPDTDKQDGPYHVDMPEMNDLRDWEDAAAWVIVQSNKEDTENFFHCLGFRLGATLRELKNYNEQIDEHLTPRQKKLNQEFVEEIASYWKGDAIRRPNDPKINKGIKVEDGPVTLHYRDIIKEAEPENFDEAWGKWHYDDDVETTSEIVRKKVLEELHRNESMLFPAREAKDDEYRSKDAYKRRDPIWSFGHPLHKVKRKQFWDINRWPVHLQSEATQQKIRNSGPAGRVKIPPKEPIVWLQKAPGGKEGLVFHGDGEGSPWLVGRYPLEEVYEPEDEEDEEDEEGEEGVRSQEQHPLHPEDQGEPEDPETPPRPRVKFAEPPTEHRAPPAARAEPEARTEPETTVDAPRESIPYWQHDLNRRRFNPRATGYWAGDTPHQRKAIEDQFKSRLETTKKESWGQRLSGAILGKPKEVDPLALPSPKFIPKSKPRSPSPGEEEEEEDVVMDEGPEPYVLTHTARAGSSVEQGTIVGRSVQLEMEEEDEDEEIEDLYDP